MCVRDGDVVCRNCGLVVESRIFDDRDNVRSFDPGEDTGRTGQGTVESVVTGRNAIGSTVIGKGQNNQGASGHDVYMLQKMHQQTSKVDVLSSSAMQDVTTMVTVMTNILRLSEASCTLATEMLRSFYEALKERRTTIRGDHRVAVQAACSYYGNKRMLPLDMVIEGYGIERGDVQKQCNNVQEMLTTIPQYSPLFAPNLVACAEPVVQDFCKAYNVGMEDAWPLRKLVSWCANVVDVSERMTSIRSSFVMAAVLLFAGTTLGIKSVCFTNVYVHCTISTATLKKHLATVEDIVTSHCGKEGIAAKVAEVKKNVHHSVACKRPRQEEEEPVVRKQKQQFKRPPPRKEKKSLEQ